MRLSRTTPTLPGERAAISIQQTLDQAQALQRQGRLAEAAALCEAVLAKAPDNFFARYMLGFLSYQAGDSQRGAVLISQAIALNPDYAEAHFNLGVILQDLGRPAEAVDAYGRATALAPGMVAAHYNCGNALRDLKRPAQALGAYDRAIAIRPDYAEAHLNRGLALRELKQPEVALTSFTQAIALKPDLAEAYCNSAAALRELNRPLDALAQHQAALAIRPDYAESYSNHGLALQDLSRSHEALASFETAIALKPDFAEAHSNRGGVLRDLKRYAEALEAFETAIALKPDYADAHYNRALALQDLGRTEEALASFDAAIALRPDLAQPRWTQGLALLQLGRMQEGWRRYEWRKQGEERSGDRPYPQPVWLGETQLAGKTLFIHSEQGFGDTLQFIRFAPLAVDRGARVIVSVQDPLVRLLRRLHPHVEIIGETEVPDAFDLHIPMLSLPLAFGGGLDDLPAAGRYLTADPTDRAAWRERLGPRSRPRVGLVWSGSTIHKNDHNRSIPLSRLAPLLDLDLDWISLHKDLRERDVEPLSRLPQIRQLGEALGDFADTAALIEGLDLVITVDTSVAHLAGALDRPTWMLAPFNADWRWLKDRADSPWYPSLRLFRQPAVDDWESVIEQVREALEAFPFADM